MPCSQQSLTEARNDQLQDDLFKETITDRKPSNDTPTNELKGTMDAGPSSHTSPDKAINAQPTTDTSTVNKVKETELSNHIGQSVNCQAPSSNKVNLTTTASSKVESKCRRRRKLIAPEKSKELTGKYQELYSTIRNKEQLIDRHIDAANQLLADKFPDIQGLSTPILGQRLQFPNYNSLMAAAGFSYIQIIHCPVIQHWLTIEISFDENVRIFDSLYLDEVSFEVKKQIASIIQTKHNEIIVKMEKVQQQKNNIDCGIYAIAFATDLCHGLDPVNCLYSDGHLLRAHFLKCLQEGHIRPFPSTSIMQKKPLLQTINIYCKCRLPYVVEHKQKNKISGVEDDVDMIYCDCCQHWFHLTCVNIDKKLAQTLADPKKEWICDECVATFDLLSDDD